MSRSNSNPIPATALPLALCLSIAAIFLFHSSIISQSRYSQLVNDIDLLRTDTYKITMSTQSASSGISTFVLDDFSKLLAEILWLSEESGYLEELQAAPVNLREKALNFHKKATEIALGQTKERDISAQRILLEKSIEESLIVIGQKFKKKTETTAKTVYGVLLTICALLATHFFLSYQPMRKNLDKAIHDRHRAHETIKKLAQRDSLTNLPGRIKFYEESEKEIASVKRYSTELSIIKLDIHNFKEINQTHGQQAGDKVLTGLSRLVRQHLRRTDSLYRLSGDKFIILAPHTSISNARNLADKLAGLINEKSFAGRIKLAVNLGVTFCEAGDNSDSLLGRVDSALKTSKKMGPGMISVIPEA